MVHVPIKKWQDRFPDSVIRLLVQAPGCYGTYIPLITEISGDEILWTITSSDLAYAGIGKCLLDILVENDRFIVGDDYPIMIAFSEVSFREAPSPWVPYVQQVMDAAEAANGAISKMPFINSVSHNWMIWNATKEEFVDSGVNAGGISPTVIVETVENGHNVTIIDASHPEGQTFFVPDGGIGGHAETANKLFHARSITISGDAAGKVSFDGSDDVTMAVTVNGYSELKLYVRNLPDIDDYYDLYYRIQDRATIAAVNAALALKAPTNHIHTVNQISDLVSLPSVSNADNGKVLKVVNGKWTAVEE